MEDGETCNTRLGLGLGIGDFTPKKQDQRKEKPLVRLDLSFSLHPKEEAIDVERKADAFTTKTTNNDDDDDDDDEEEDERATKNSDSCNKYRRREAHGRSTYARKKLRLTKEQSALLEDSFKLHTTLNPTQKVELAERLNLQARQVEVWFQNRRARTKLKQTEVDCEFLKKCCESLTNENRRLKKELQELRSLKLGPSAAAPLYFQLPKPTALAMCASCKKTVKAGAGKNPAILDVVLKTNKLQGGFDGRS